MMFVLNGLLVQSRVLVLLLFSANQVSAIISLSSLSLRLLFAIEACYSLTSAVGNSSSCLLQLYSSKSTMGQLLT
jgi:hypothetical protein